MQLNLKNRSLACGFFMAVSLMLTGCGKTAPADVQETDPNEIAGVYLGMSEADVVAHLGEPDFRSDILQDRVEFSYQGLSVSLIASGPSLDSSKAVMGVRASSSEHCFRRDICPDDTLAEIRKTLGPADIEAQTKDKPKRLFYPLPELETCWLWIYTHDSLTASDVRLACQP